MTDETAPDKTQTNPVVPINAPRPSSPRKFFARIYGHLEEPNTKAKAVENRQECESDSSSDVEIEGISSPIEAPSTFWPPPTMPICPRPMLLQHHQIAFGAGLAAFREYL